MISRQPISFDLIRHIELSKIDLIHFHAPNFFANAILLYKLYITRRRIPVIVTHHMDVFGRRTLRGLVLPLYRLLVRRSSAVVVTSAKNALISRDLPPGAPFKVIPLGIDTETYRPSDVLRGEAEDWKRRIVGDAEAIGFIGRHARYKGIDVLVRALAELENTHALIAGDGPYRASAEQLARELGISDRVHFLGSLTEDEKKIFFAALDVFVFPSTEITEAFGVALLEAMSAGIPVVASDIPTGVTDVAVHEKTALLVRPGDSDQLAASISLLLRDPELSKEIASTAQQRTTSVFDARIVSQQMRDLVDDCLNRAC